MLLGHRSSVKIKTLRQVVLGGGVMLDVEQQVFTLPRADDLKKGLVFAFLDCMPSRDEALPKHVFEIIALIECLQRVLQAAWQFVGHIVGAGSHGGTGVQFLAHAEQAAGEARCNSEIGVSISAWYPVFYPS